MSIETLLEAAKFVEWSDQIGHAARGQNDPEDFNLNPNGQNEAVGDLGAMASTVPSSPSSSPGSHKSLSPGTSYCSQQLSTSNTDTFDEGDEKRSGTREVHNKLEKNRRAHLKECFDNLRDTIPNMDDKKMKPSNLSILQGALRYLQALKRKERELEYETEKLARQKIQYQEKLAKLSGCSLPPWKKDEPEIKEDEEEEGEVMEDNNEDDRDSVSTSTSTASEAEEEERKSRGQSPEVKLAQPVQQIDKPEHIAGAPTVTNDLLPDHIIKVTQSVKEQSGPFVISRRIVTHVPISTAAAGQQQLVSSTHMPAGTIQQHGSNHRKKTDQPQTMAGPLGQMQQWVVGTKRHVETAKQIAKQKVPGLTQVVAQQVAATQNVVIRPLSGAQNVDTQQVTTPKSVGTKQSSMLKQVKQTSSQGQPITQPKITSHVVRQFDSHSSAVSAVQEHLKNRAQNKLPQQQKQPSRTVSHTTPSTETVLSSKGNVTVVNTAAATTTTSAAGATRQTVSQLLGKQSTVIRQPVRRTDNKFVVQRVVRHPFSPRPQTIDIMPKSPTTLPSNDVTKTHVTHSTPTSITVVTYKESQPSHMASTMPITVPVASGNTTGTVNKQGIPTSPITVQHAKSPAGLDMRNLIGHNVVLPSIPHYLPTAGLGTTMLRPSLTNPSVLTAANAALLSQAMIASTKNISPQLTIPGSKDNSPAKLHPPATGPLSFLPPSMTRQSKVSNMPQVKSPSYTTPTCITPVHPFLSPGLTLQPALTQVLFTQPPIATYTVANSSLSRSLKTTLSPQTVIRHPLLPAAGSDGPHVVTTIATVVGTSSSITHTTVAMTMPPVVTIGAVSFNPLLGTNRALVTAPTYTTLSFGQYPNYRFPFTGQVPFISPVAFTGNSSGTAVPATSVGNHPATNVKTSNGVIVHTVAVPTAMPVTSTWLSSTTMSNGVPAKELTLPVSTSTLTPTSVAIVTTQPAMTRNISSSHEGGVSDSVIASGSSVSAKSSS